MNKHEKQLQVTGRIVHGVRIDGGHGGAIEISGLRLDDPVSLLAPLARALAPVAHQPGAAAVLMIGGEPVAPEVTVGEAGLIDGTELRWCAQPTLGESEPPPVAHLTQVAGRDAGHTAGLHPGSQIVGPADTMGGAQTGRGPSAPRSVWCRVTAGPAGITATGFAAGVSVDGQTPAELRLSTGQSARCRTPHGIFDLHTSPTPNARDDRRAGDPAGWTRPPRVLDTAEDQPITAPELGDPPADPPGLSWISALAPVPIALVMALVYRPIFALFAAMGPVVAVARWLDGRRRHRRDTKAHAAALAAARAELDRLVVRQRLDEHSRRRTAHPTIAELTRRAHAADHRLWERRPDHPDFGHVAIAIGSTPWSIEITRGPATSWAESPVHTELHDVPLVSDLTNGPLGIAGRRPVALRSARAAVISAATSMGPADLAISLVVDADRLADWEWLKWLPHLDNAPPRAIDDALLIGNPRPPVALNLVIVDSADPARGAGADDNSTGVVLARRVADLPSTCTTVADVVDDRMDLTTVADGVHHGDLVPIGVSAARAERIARALAPITDPDAIDAASGGLPAEVRLDELVPTGIDADHLVATWRCGGADPAPVAVIGSSTAGLLTIDLERDGPHALVAGTTGSGKSELLRTLTASLALTNSPDHLRFVLIDYKGGGAFDACAGLPHCAAVVTDLDGQMGERALAGLQAELRRREETLRTTGAADLSEHRRRGGALPRLIVIVDEFATLAVELPDVLDALVDMAQRGRSLGMHLVLATQRPAGVLDAKIRTNTNLRIALRVQDDSDSLDVIGTVDAARLPRSISGRGIVRLGAGELVPFQAAYSGGPSIRRDRRPPITWRPFLLAPPPTAPSDAAAPPTAAGGDGVGQLHTIVRASAVAADRYGSSPTEPLWAPPLPHRLEPASLTASLAAPRPGEPGELCLGLADDPGTLRHEPVTVDLAEGHIVIVSPDTRRSAAALLALATGVAERGDPGGARRGAGDSSESGAHLYVVDGHPHPLAGIADLPQCGAHIGLDDIERIDRLLAHLGRLMTRTRAAGPITPTVLVVDGLDRLLATVEDPASDTAAAAAHLHGLIEKGARAGISIIGSMAHERGLSSRLLTHMTHRAVMAPVDPGSLLTFGVNPRTAPSLVGHQALLGTTGRHIALVAHETTAAAAAHIDRIGRSAAIDRNGEAPQPIRTLAEALTDALTGRRLELPEAADDPDGHRVVPVGLDVADLTPVGLRLRGLVPVLGPPGSGRSTVLRRIAAELSEHDPGDTVVLRGDRPADKTVQITTVHIKTVHIKTVPVLLVDDAELLPPDVVDAVLSREARPDLITVVATTPPAVSSPISDLRVLRGRPDGVLLQPRPTDSDLFGFALPPRSPQERIAGRGYVIRRRRQTLVQIADVPPEPVSPDDRRSKRPAVGPAG